MKRCGGGASGWRSGERKWRRGAETPVLLAAVRGGACLKATSFFSLGKASTKHTDRGGWTDPRVI